ncbi:hypothetical protein HWV62_15785 [Athelia sp. TMB]|nr:hypothetical protein HWV62_15785 [Athelia sp. TMB]
MSTQSSGTQAFRVICPNPACARIFSDINSHLFSESQSPCGKWMLANLPALCQEVEDLDSEEDEDLPSLIPADQAAEGDGERVLSGPAPPATVDVSPQQVSLSGLQIVPHPNQSATYPGHPGGGNILQQIDHFDHNAAFRVSTGNVFLPLSSKRDWQLAKWLTEASLSHRQINSFLKLDRIKAQPPSFASAVELRECIESLPDIPAEWLFRDITIPGYRTKEPIVLYYRDGLKVVENLFGNPIFANCMEFSPYTLQDEAGEPVVGEFMSGRFAWEYQSTKPFGSTTVGIILASDKTPLTVGTGNKEMHPVLISIANISAGVRMKATSHAFAILAYLAIPKFLDVQPSVHTSLATRVYHASFDIFTASLKRAEQFGHFMPDPRGDVRLCFTPLISHILDMAEQRIFALVLGNQSPTSTASYHEFGDPSQHPPRTRDHILGKIALACKEAPAHDVPAYTRAAARHGILGAPLPYWRDWGHAEPSLVQTPDALHAFHKFFFDHPVAWIISMIGGDELDRRLQALPISVGVRHWTHGVSKLKQVTGREHRDLEKVIVAVIAGAVPDTVLCALRALVEFIFLSQGLLLYRDQMHAIREALNEFHAYKYDIIRAGGRRGKNGPIMHFKIPKLEAMWRIVYNAEYMGAPYQFTSDITERCHMSHVKQPFRASNRRNFVEQCARYMDRVEKVALFDLYTRLKHNGASLLNIMVDEASTVADHYPEATWMSHVLPQEESKVGGARSRPSLASKTRSRLSEDSSIAFLVGLKPHHPLMSIFAASQLFNIRDLHGALADYFDNVTPRSESRPRVHSTPCQLDFSHINIWNNLRIQQRSSQDRTILLPIRTLQALPPSTEKPFGRCDTVLINDFVSGSPTKDSAGDLPTKRPNSTQSPDHYCYVDLFEFSRDGEHRDEDGVAIPASHIDMFVVRRRYRDRTHRLTDVIAMTDIREIVELVPIFGKRIAADIDCNNSLELDNFYLNSFANKEAFHSILSYQ